MTAPVHGGRGSEAGDRPSGRTLESRTASAEWAEVVTGDSTEMARDEAFIDTTMRSIQIVLGTAGGPGSARVAAWTADLTRLLGGELEIVAAYARRSAEEPPDVALELKQRTAGNIRRWAIANQLATVPVRTMERDPEEALALAARDLAADLVVIGSDDEEGATSLGFGSIAHRLAHHLHCPLIVVPPGDTTIEGGVIVVGADGAPSDLALRWASDLAVAIGARVVAVSNAGGSDAAATLREVAATLDAALIVVEAKRHHNLGGLLLGAVADHLLHRPSRAVAVLPPGYSRGLATQTPRSPQGGSR